MKIIRYCIILEDQYAGGVGLRYKNQNARLVEVQELIEGSIESTPLLTDKQLSYVELFRDAKKSGYRFVSKHESPFQIAKRVTTKYFKENWRHILVGVLLVLAAVAVFAGASWLVNSFRIVPTSSLRWNNFLYRGDLTWKIAKVAAETTQVAPEPTAETVVAASYIAKLFTPSVQHWNDRIQAWAGQYSLDANLIATVMQIESCGNPNVTSSSNAQGLFQVMPFHFSPGENMLDPDTNAKRGMEYLSLTLQRSGNNAGLAMAGYNGGASVIGLHPSLWTDETRRYKYWGDGIYDDAKQNLDRSSRLDEWLNAGGSSLCDNARVELGIQ